MGIGVKIYKKESFFLLKGVRGGSEDKGIEFF